MSEPEREEWNEREAAELRRLELMYGDTDRIEATCDWYDHDRDDLMDDGRSDGYGESYAERNA